LLKQANALRLRNKDLQERMEEFRRAKIATENRVEDLKRDKERQRTKIAELKKHLDEGNRLNSQLRLKCLELEEAYVLLQSQTRDP
jgi:hypothetical protein